MFMGKLNYINYIFWKKKNKTKRKNPADIMLYKACMIFFLSFTLHEIEVPPEILTRSSVLLSPSGPSAAILANCQYAD